MFLEKEQMPATRSAVVQNETMTPMEILSAYMRINENNQDSRIKRNIEVSRAQIQYLEALQKNLSYNAKELTNQITCEMIADLSLETYDRSDEFMQVVRRIMEQRVINVEEEVGTMFLRGIPKKDLEKLVKGLKVLQEMTDVTERDAVDIVKKIKAVLHDLLSYHRSGYVRCHVTKDVYLHKYENGKLSRENHNYGVTMVTSLASLLQGEMYVFHDMFVFASS